MDRKALKLLKEYHQIMIDRTFIERDVLGLLIFIREFLPDGELKELSNFIAHRNRNQGITYNFVKKIEAALNSNHTISLDDVITNENVFYSPKIIKQELNTFFKSVDMPELSNLSVTEFIICLMCILQTVSIFKGDGTKICEFEMYVYKDKVLLHANVNWALSSSDTVIPFGIPIMGVTYTTDNFPEDIENGSCIGNSNTFSAIRGNDKILIK